MPLQKARIAIQFAQGVDTKTDAKAVAIAKLRDLQNAVFTKNGTLSKRNGYRALGRGPWETPYAIGKRQDELIVFGDAQAFSYRSSSDTWSTIGPVSSVVATANPVARTGTDQTVPDAATNGGITVLAWEDNRGGVWYSVLDASSLRVLVAATQLDAGGSIPRCLAVGEVLHVLWVNGTNVMVAVVNPTIPTSVPSPTPLIVDLWTVNPTYDAVATFGAVDATNQPGLIVWRTGTGFSIGYIHPSGVLGSPVTGLPTVGSFSLILGGAAIGCCLAPDGSSAMVVCVASGDVVYRFINPTNLSDSSLSHGNLAGFATWSRVTCAFVGSLVWWAAESNGASADLHAVTSGSVDQSGNVTTNAIVRGHCLASRAFADADDVYCAIVHSVLFFPYVAICQISGSMCAQGRLLPGLSTGILGRNILPSVFAVGDRQYAVPLGYRLQLAGPTGTQFGEEGVQLFVLDFNHADAYRSTELGRGLYLAGALIQHYDGDRFAEHNFHCAPDTASGTIATVNGAGGNLTSGKVYVYKFLYEEIDAQGELHPGPVSIGTVVTLGGGDSSVSVTVPTYRLTSKRRVRIGVFRSLESDSAPDDPEAIEYFRVSSVDPTATGPNGYLANDPTVDSLTFVDEMGDDTAAKLEPLYTNGGILSNDPEQSGGESVVGGKTRLFWLDPLDPNVVNYSQALRDNTAAELSAFLSVRVDPFGGDIVALAVMDDNVIVFKERAIFAFGGPGPDADGTTTQDAFTPPQLVTSDVGCSSPSSITNTPPGLVFQSDKGIYLLGRELQVKRIGDNVFAYRAQHISSSALLPGRPHIVFLTDADQGRTLLFDYDRGEWSTFTNHVGIDSVVIDGNYYYLRTDGNVYIETPGLYRDGTRHIPMRIDTAWIKMTDALQGWQKIFHAHILGNYLSEHTLNVSYQLDYEPAWSAPYPLDVDDVYTPDNYGAGAYGDSTYGPPPGTPNLIDQQRIHISQRCQAIAFRFEDVEDADSYGAAFELSELLLTGGVVGPVVRPFPASRTS